MFINATGIYTPRRIVSNHYFSELTGRDPEWFERVTGIVERRRAASDETTDTMAVSAVADLVARHTIGLHDIDLIIGASYTPNDTIATHAHIVQRHFSIDRARVLTVSAACSSLVNALEVAALFIASGRARNALLVASEHNSRFASDSDDQSGHLWGDGAIALLLSREKMPDGIELIDVTTAGLACVGHGPAAIGLRVEGGGLVMPHGRDVFQHACKSMVDAARAMLRANEMSVSDLHLLIPHQANKRILDRVASDLALPTDRLVTSLRHLGNTGCASVGIALHLNQHRLKAQERALLVTFGGGYSVGTALLQRH